MITKSLNPPTITPNFGQSPVTLDWDKASVASRPGPVRAPDSSAPQPPGARSAGPVEFRVRFNPLMPSGRFGAGPIFISTRFNLVGDQFAGAPQQAADDAPSITPGFDATPLCTTTSSRSMSLSEKSPFGISLSGTVKVCVCPFQSPSFTQRRTTL